MAQLGMNEYVKEEPDERVFTSYPAKWRTLANSHAQEEMDEEEKLRAEQERRAEQDPQAEHRAPWETEADEGESIPSDNLLDLSLEGLENFFPLFGTSPPHVTRYEHHFDNFPAALTPLSLKRKASDDSIRASSSQSKKVKSPVSQTGSTVDVLAKTSDSPTQAKINEKPMKQNVQEDLRKEMEPQYKASLEKEREEAEKKLASVEKDRDEAYERETIWLRQIKELESQLAEAKSKQAAIEVERNEGFGEAAKWYDQLQDVILEKDRVTANLLVTEQNRDDACNALAKLRQQHQQILHDRNLWRERCLQMANANKAAHGGQQQQQGKAVGQSQLIGQSALEEELVQQQSIQQQQGQAIQQPQFVCQPVANQELVQQQIVQQEHIPQQQNVLQKSRQQQQLRVGGQQQQQAGRSLTPEAQQRILLQRQFLHSQNMQQQAAQRQVAQQLALQQQQQQQQQQNRTPRTPALQLQYLAQNQQILDQQQSIAHANHQAQGMNGQQMQQFSVKNIPIPQHNPRMTPQQNMVMAQQQNMRMNQGQMGNDQSATMNE